MSRRLIQPDDLLSLRFIGDTQISPDGSQILFNEKRIDAKNKYVGHLYAVEVDSPHRVRQWTSGEKSVVHGRWSPSGQSIAFISNREDEKSQIFILDAHGGEARRLTDMSEGSVEGFKWSPDEKFIAFTFRPVAEDRTKAAAAARKEKGESNPPWVITDLWYRLDGDGYFGAQRYAIYLVEVATGAVRELYAGGKMGSYTYSWTPDSQALVVCHSVQPNPWFDKPNDQLFRVDINGNAVQLPGLPIGSKSWPSCSPDGVWIAYLGDVSLDDPWGVRNTKLYVAPAAGGEPRCLTESDDYCLAAWTLGDVKEAGGDGAPIWSPDSKAIYLQIGHHGEQQIGYVAVEKGGVEVLTKGHHVIGLGSLSANGERIACAITDVSHPNEVGVYDIGRHQDAPERLTQRNQEWLDQLDLAPTEEVWLDSTDGARVQTWFMKPIGFTEGEKYPAILEIHGGPHTQYGWTCFHEFQCLAAAGYVVVFSNPRGSKGYGESHCAAIKGDWGNKDWDDMQTVTAWMKSQPFIDAAKLGVMGGSYGGYMTNWIVGHCQDFRAAITDRCVSNMVSMAGNSDFAFDKDGYFGGYAFGDLDKIKDLWRQSPLAYFDQVKTPMLIIHSEGDLRCNIEQGEQVFAALQVQGIESRFVRYPVETSHGLSRNGPPDLRLHRLGEILGWWAKWMA